MAWVRGPLARLSAGGRTIVTPQAPPRAGGDRGYGLGSQATGPPGARGLGYVGHRPAWCKGRGVLPGDAGHRPAWCGGRGVLPGYAGHRPAWCGTSTDSALDYWPAQIPAQTRQDTLRLGWGHR